MSRLSISKIEALKEKINAELKRRANSVGGGSLADKSVSFTVAPSVDAATKPQQGESLFEGI